jgi:hypothetical protein
MPRIYGGIRFREVCEKVLKQGKLVAESVLKNIKLKCNLLVHLKSSPTHKKVASKFFKQPFLKSIAFYT